MPESPQVECFHITALHCAPLTVNHLTATRRNEILQWDIIPLKTCCITNCHSLNYRHIHVLLFEASFFFCRDRSKFQGQFDETKSGKQWQNKRKYQKNIVLSEFSAMLISFGELWTRGGNANWSSSFHFSFSNPDLSLSVMIENALRCHYVYAFDAVYITK